MRVTQRQIVRGITDYMKDEILPKMEDNRAVQIVLSVAINAAASNEKTTDAIFANDMVRSVLDDDGSGTYDIGVLMDSVRQAVNQYGTFPIQIPPIPFVSPQGITLRLNAADVDAIRRRIEANA